MKIEVLYFAGCPNHEPALQLIREVLEEQGLSAAIHEVNIIDAADAQRLRFLGSPTIRVDGVDIEPSARSSQDYGMMCRTYNVDGRTEGVPSRAMIRSAFKDAQPDRKLNGPTTPTPRSSWLAVGSILASVAASLCCILPIVFALAGVSILGASAMFDSFRPYLLGVTAALLAAGFYSAYRPSGVVCLPGSACPVPPSNRSGRILLWVSTALVVLLAAFPYYSGTVARLVLR